jgi:Fe-S cluster biosynthesis and repair protein YggX
MTDDQKQAFLENELYHELRCLLGSATVWQIFKKTNAGYDVIVAEDSAFIHARTLFEFFTSKKRNKNILRIVEFGPSKYRSSIYATWKPSLNRHVLHLNEKRLNPNNLKTDEHLSEQVEVFAREVLSLWKQFENDPEAASFRPILVRVRERAIADAKNDATGRIEPLFI